MLTYVINTSENKTFDSRMLFELAGYSKIRWLQCSLDAIDKTAESICEKQNVVGAEPFRIAVIVDFYHFDRIRKPYAKQSFTKDSGVDLSLYIPYIEVFLLDNVISLFEQNNLFIDDFEIFYVQNEKSEHYDLFKNAKSQLKQILSGDERTARHLERPTEEAPAPEPVGEDCTNMYNELEGYDEEDPDEKYTEYRTFLLHCTPNVSLAFHTSDYPYGSDAMTFSAFRDAFRGRQSFTSSMRRHYYVVPYGGGSSRAALALLSLSLYLIRMYEREERIPSDGDMDVFYLDSNVLKDVLETSWSKVNVAKDFVKKSNTQYYALQQNVTDDSLVETEAPLFGTEAAKREGIARERAALPEETVQNKKNAEQLYKEIMEVVDRKPGEVEDANREEFDKMMDEYLSTRDATKAADVEQEFLSMKAGGFLEMTEQCPSREEYNHYVERKEKNISARFERTLRADYIEVDYNDEHKTANDTYIEYKRAKACLSRNIVGDIIFMILTVLAMFVPYLVLQLTSYQSETVSSVLLGIQSVGIFTGVFLLAMILRLLPILARMKAARRKMNSCYLDVCAKRNYSFSALRQRYEKDLIAIEQARYDLRQLKHLYEANAEKEALISEHRETLKRLENCLGSILNNLDVEPVFDPLLPIEEELNINKPVYAKENRIYQVFSVETIEKMIPTKGSDRE